METNRLIPYILLFALFSGINSMVSAFSLSRKVDSIQVVFDNQQLVLPGESFRIGVISYDRNGKIKKTVGALGGSVWWWKYKVDVGGGSDFSGKISVNEQLIPSKGKYISVYVFPRKQPDLAKELLIPLNYETKITYQSTNQYDKAPGSQIWGEIISEFDNGIKRIYNNLNRDYDAKFFNFSTSGGYWKGGRFIIDPDFRNIENHQAKLLIKSLRNTMVSDTFAVHLDYNHNYSLYVSGSSGAPGSSGSNGISGFWGGNGSCAQAGQTGEFGFDGPDVNVWVDLYRDSLLNQDLLYVFAQSSQNNKEYSYLINPSGGGLEVTTRGGDGGKGGSGGTGGSGLNGHDGEIWIEKHLEKQIVKKPIVKKRTKKEKKKVTDKDGNETEIEIDVEFDETTYVDEEILVEVAVEKQGSGTDGYDGGCGGAGGCGGMGGYGGNITLYFTDDAWPYQRLFVPRSIGGNGGMHGSGGSGGNGGRGGQGNPNGVNGANGSSGPSVSGWAESGRNGKIAIEPTEEFFFYTAKEQAVDK